MSASQTGVACRWGLTYAACGSLVALGHHLIQTLAVAYPAPLFWVWPRAVLRGLLFTALAWGQWRLLRAWFPALTRWWLAATVCSTIALFVGYTLLSDRVAHAPLAMVTQLFNDVGMPGWLGAAHPSFVLGYAEFVIVGAALAQAPLLRRHTDAGAGWVLANGLAAAAMCLVLAGLTRLPLLAPRAISAGGLGSGAGNCAVTAASYAALGAVTGAGFGWLIRRQRTNAPIELSNDHGRMLETWPD